MAHGQFIWCDLSTFRPDVTRRFYSALMGWRFDGGDYAVASSPAGAVAGLFQMPDMFVKIGMPSFWMSYIAVDDVEAAAQIASAEGGKVELGPATFDGGGRYALIRDPLGAGFTVYEGEALASTVGGTGARLAHHAFVSEARAVRDFYAKLFGWTYGPAVHGTAPIYAGDALVAHIHEVPDEAIRGREQYWAIVFDGDASRVVELGGTHVARVPLPGGAADLVRDPDGAAFLLSASGAGA